MALGAGTTTPDPVPPLVDIVTQNPGQSAEEIERYITIPIETQVAGLKNLRTLRTISLYGLSDVKLQFSFDYTYDEALQQVLNRLSQLSPLPHADPLAVLAWEHFPSLHESVVQSLASSGRSPSSSSSLRLPALQRMDLQSPGTWASAAPSGAGESTQLPAVQASTVQGSSSSQSAGRVQGMPVDPPSLNS